MNKFSWKALADLKGMHQIKSAKAGLVQKQTSDGKVLQKRYTGTSEMRSRIAVLLILLTVATAGAQLSTLKDFNLKAEQPVLENLDRCLNNWQVKKALSHREKAHPGLPAALPNEYLLRNRISPLTTFFNLDYHPKIRRYLELFIQEKRQGTEALLGLGQIWGRQFGQELRRFRLPENLKYLPAILSAYDPGAVSENGNTGAWQLNYPVARRYGLKINPHIDERRTLKSTNAALNYLARLKEKYQDWMLALVAFISGPANLNKAVERSGGGNGFWELYPFLPIENRDYLPAFIAFTYVTRYHDEYGLKPLLLPPPQTEVEIHPQENISLQAVSDLLKIPMGLLKHQNPAFFALIAPKGDAEYPLILPGSKKAAFLALEDSLYRLSSAAAPHSDLSGDEIPDGKTGKADSHPGTESKTGKTDFAVKTKPGTNKTSKPKATVENKTKTNNRNLNIKVVPAGAPPGKVLVYHTIKPGENLGAISEFYGVGLTKLKAWNGLRNNTIYSGKKLKVYVSPARKKQLAAQPGSSQNQKTNPSPNQSKKTFDPGLYKIYVVKEGDNLWAIAQKYPDVNEQDIMKFNNIDINIKPGQKIKIPILKP